MLQVGQLHVLTDGIYAGEIFADKCFVDYREFARIIHLCDVEHAALEECYAQQGEIVLAAQLKERVPFFGVGLTWDFDFAGKSAVRRKRAALRNIWQNITIALGLKLVFLATTLFGVTSLWMAILADTGATVLVTANASRLLRFRTAAWRE